MAVELILCREALHCRISDCLPSPCSVHVQRELLDPTVPVHAESAAKTMELTAKCSGMWDIHYKSNCRIQDNSIAVHFMWATLLDGSILKMSVKNIKKNNSLFKSPGPKGDICTEELVHQ